VNETSTSKAELRARLRQARRALAVRFPDADSLAAARVPLDRLPAFTVVAGYHALGSELDPHALMARLAGERAARLVLPVALARDAPLTFRAWTPGAPTHPDVFGIPGPTAQAAELVPDLIITPVLAFDRTGARLGQGAGCYDRTLANLRASRKVFVLGLAYAGQEVDGISAEPHDQRLDAILTETGYTEFG
jgi:5-formyltetrahydrofolate cyclo-ligase